MRGITHPNCCGSSEKELAKSREDGPRAMMKKAIASANHQLIAESKTDARLEGMGTTLVAATVIEHTLYFANVGDSRSLFTE